MNFGIGFLAGAAVGIVAGSFFLYSYAQKVAAAVVAEFRKVEAEAVGKFHQVESIAGNVKKDL